MGVNGGGEVAALPEPLRDSATSLLACGARDARPGPVAVQWASGAKQWIEVRDVTREVLVSVWALGAALALGWWLFNRTER